jgi:hypothetical protein
MRMGILYPAIPGVCRDVYYGVHDGWECITVQAAAVLSMGPPLGV